MPEIADWPMWANVIAFLVATLAIGVAGTRMAALADHLADRTGMGEALAGALFLGVSTSLPGITTSVTAAADGFPGIAMANAFGGILAQTAFLAVGDVFHRRSNLEHAAASPENMIQAGVLISLLALVLVSMTGPEVTAGPIHPATVLLIVAYLFGLRLVYRTRSKPMWRPRLTGDTVPDVPEERSKQASLRRLWIEFIVVAAVVFVAGVVVARSGAGMMHHTGLSESIIGGLFTAVSTSLPELITCIACVRRGALTLAVSDIIGGNAFDILFVCAADVAYVEGSLYHAASGRETFLAGLAILLNIVLLLGLIHRERSGIANIGFESMLVLAFYLGGFLIVGLAM